MRTDSQGPVLVTGAAGFVGGATVSHLLENGFDVVALLHRTRSDAMLAHEREGRIRTITASVTDADALNEAIEQIRPSAIVHCASRVTDLGREWRFRETILEGTRNVVEAVKKFDIPRLVHISTTDVYGLQDFENADEQTPYVQNPSNPYPKFKIRAEELIRRELPDRAVILRPAAIWGPGDKLLTPRIIDMLRGFPWIIHFGRWRGQNRWPAVHVDTVCRAIRVALTADEALGEAYNVVDSEPVTMDAFYRGILEEHVPERKGMRSVTLPFWVGALLGALGTFFGNLLDRSEPVFDPTWYGLYTLSCNLGFSTDKLEALFAREDSAFARTSKVGAAQDRGQQASPPQESA